MAEARLSGVGRRRRRRWSFAGCVFDEANWALIVDGQRVAVESKPLELLRQLLERGGDLVSKDELLDAIWPDVVVVEASLPTAVRKLRSALNDDGREHPIIETVPRIGYRLAVPVDVEDLLTGPAQPLAAAQAAQGGHSPEPASAVAATGSQWPALAGSRLLFVLGGLAIGTAAVALALAPSPPLPATKVDRPFNQQDAADAIRKLDIGTIEKMLDAGWHPDTPFDDQGNGALNWLLNICEWDPGHDRRKLLLMARTLIDGGSRLDRHNVWGDTPYSIAKADRYCGPDHPVTKMIATLCTAGGEPLGDRCLAYRDLAARS